MGEYLTLVRMFYSLLLVTGRIRDIGQKVLQSSFVNRRIRNIGQKVLQYFGNWANT